MSRATTELTALGTTVQLTVEVRDQNARVMAGATVTWTTSTSSVATVDAAGLVTAVGNGTATITASAGSASGSAVVTVTQSVASVEVSPSVDELTVLGATVQLTAEGFDANGDAVESAQFSWESSDAPVATVDASGLVTGVTVGVATITASAGSGQGTAEITVMNLERAALIALYEATDGPNWVDAENWLTDAPLGEWYGVDTDASGRVVRLDLGGRWDNDAREWIPHGLTGPIPTELGSLVSLTRLDLGYNELAGPIPTELANLVNLFYLRVSYNELSGLIPRTFQQLDRLGNLYVAYNDMLCVPGTSAFVEWLQGIEHHDADGSLCNAADLATLRSLYEATGGTSWAESDNWLSEDAVSDWHGVSADALGRVTALDLAQNGLVGELPAS